MVALFEYVIPCSSSINLKQDSSSSLDFPIASAGELSMDCMSILIYLSMYSLSNLFNTYSDNTILD